MIQNLEIVFLNLVEGIDFDVFDQGIYMKLCIVWNEVRFEFDGIWYQILLCYVVLQVVQNVIFIVIVVVVVVVFNVVFEQDWVWILVGVILLIMVIMLVILFCQVKVIGYMFCVDDIVFCKGIFWQWMIVVFYGCMQLVDIIQGFFDCVFGVLQLKMVMVVVIIGVQILGLMQVVLEVLCDIFIQVVEMCWIGL